MGDEATQKWMDKLRELRRERRNRSIDRRHRRAEHLRTLQQTGRSPGGSGVRHECAQRPVRRAALAGRRRPAPPGHARADRGDGTEDHEQIVLPMWVVPPGWEASVMPVATPTRARLLSPRRICVCRAGSGG